MRRLALLLAVPVVLAACGGGESRAERAAACLNAKGYLVTPDATSVSGQSPDGVTFVLGLGSGKATIDDSGNPPAKPGGKPRRLTPERREEIRACAA